MKEKMAIWSIITPTVNIYKIIKLKLTSPLENVASQRFVTYSRTMFFYEAQGWIKHVFFKKLFKFSHNFSHFVVGKGQISPTSKISWLGASRCMIFLSPYDHTVYHCSWAKSVFPACINNRLSQAILWCKCIVFKMSDRQRVAYYSDVRVNLYRIERNG